MRALDKLISFIFSIIMLVVSITLILVGVGVVEPQMIIDLLNNYVFIEDIINENLFNALTIAGIILFLASLKTTIFLSLFKVKDKSPILVKTQNGEVEIAQETIISTVKNVGLSFENIKEVQAKMVKKGRGIVIYSVVLVYANSNIREITEEMQKQVKEVIKSTTGVNVIEVNIKVRNLYPKQKKGVEERSENIDTVNEKVSEPTQIANNEKAISTEVKEVSEEVADTKNEENEELDQISMDETAESEH